MPSADSALGALIRIKSPGRTAATISRRPSFAGDWRAAMRVRSDQIGPDRLRRLLDAANEVIVLFDRDLRHRFVSESIERVTGRSRQEFIGKTNRELVMPPELCARWDETLKRVLARGEIVRDKIDFPGTGGLRQFEVTLEPELDDNGAVVGVISAACDITRHNAAEHALAKRNEQPVPRPLRCQRRRLGVGFKHARTQPVARMPSSLWPHEHRFRLPCSMASKRPSGRHCRCIERLRRSGCRRTGQYRYEFRVQHPQRGTR